MSDGCCAPDAGRAWRRDTSSAPDPRAPTGALDVLAGLVPLEGGTFVMGTDGLYGYGEDGEGPAHEVCASSFSIARFAVTNAQFAAFVQAVGYRTEAEQFGWSFVFAPFLLRIFLRRARSSVRRGGGRSRAPIGRTPRVRTRLAVVDRQQEALAVLRVQMRVRRVPLALEIRPVAARAKPIAQSRHRVGCQPEHLLSVVGVLRQPVGLRHPVQRRIVPGQQRCPARRTGRRDRIVVLERDAVLPQALLPDAVLVAELLQLLGSYGGG